MMFKKSQILLFYLLIALSANAQGQSNVFEKSVELLQNEDLSGAISAMDSIINYGQASPELYSNLAQAYFSQGEKAKAMLYYEKALLLDPKNSDILKSIDAIRKQLDVQITDIPDFILVTYYRNIVNLFSASSWSALQLLFGMITIALLFFHLFPRTNQFLGSDRIKILGISALVLSIMFLVFANSKKSYELGGSQGIVMKSSISLHKAPDKLSPEVAPIGDGNKIFIISELGEWYKVSLRDKDTGWVKKEEVAII